MYGSKILHADLAGSDVDRVIISKKMYFFNIISVYSLAAYPLIIIIITASSRVALIYAPHNIDANCSAQLQLPSISVFV